MRAQNLMPYSEPIPCTGGLLGRIGAAAARLFGIGPAAPRTSSIRYWGAGENGLAPVVFVHGYCGSERVWSPLRAALSTAGFNCLIALCYNAITSTVDQVADRLADEALRAMDATGAPGVHLIGHSLGGLVVREAVQRRGLAAYTRAAVTIATPHAGTWVARFAPGPCARQMRPGSPFLTELGATGFSAGPRWLVLQGQADRVVPPRSAMLDAVAPRVVTLRPRDAGHRSITGRADVVQSIVAEPRPVRPPLATGPRHRVRRSPGFARTAGPRVRGPCGRSGNRLNHRERRPPTAFLAGVACGHRLRADRRTPSRCADSIRHGPG